MKIGGSGDTQITALIQDSKSVISCYDIIVPIPSINNSSIDKVTDEISHIINADNTINHMDIISIFSTINNIKDITHSHYFDITEITDKLLNNLFKTSVVLNNNYTSSLRDKLLEISTLVAVTYNIEYMEYIALDILTDKYIPKLLQSVTNYNDIDMDIENIYRAMAVELCLQN